MKITLINTSDLNGGAAIACYRLHEAHLANGVESTMLVQEKMSTPESIKRHESILPTSINQNLHHYLEKLFFLPYESNKELRFAFSTGQFGKDIQNHPSINDADIIHLHWINKGFVSISTLDELAKLNKPIVWTMHDMWPFTGGCHYSGCCTRYKKECGRCMFLSKPSDIDLSNKIWRKKKNIYNRLFTFVGCSNWLAKIAQQSSLLHELNVLSIPNCINTNLFIPKHEQVDSNEKQTILFQAININDERKGLKYLIESLKFIEFNHPEFKNRIKLLIFGKASSSENLENLDYEIELLGSLSSQKEIIKAYQRSHVFVLPSMQDNLPNTIMESLSCGVPVVGFNTGGIPEMVDHKINGYIAPKGNSQELAEGIKWILSEDSNYKKLRQNARLKVLSNYTYDIISNKYLNLYKGLA